MALSLVLYAQAGIQPPVIMVILDRAAAPEEAAARPRRTDPAMAPAMGLGDEPRHGPAAVGGDGQAVAQLAGH